MKKGYIIILTFFSVWSATAQIQDTTNVKPKKVIKPQVIKPLKLSLNEDGSHYIQFTGLVQAWVRYDQSNPNSTVNKQTANAENTFDIGLRRVRFQTMGQLTDRAFFYTQIGENSFSYLSERKFGLFLMDATGDYEFIKKHLAIGAGLGSWVGPLRFSSPSVATFMGTDGPIYQQTTNDLNDQFVRRMMIYAKGKIGKLDYRISVAKPFIVNSAANIAGTGQAGVGLLSTNGFQNNVATFSTRGANPQLNTYLSYQFFDQESNKTPYNTGTYLGTKKVFNIGGGFQYQKDAMWYTTIADPINAPTKVDTVSQKYLTFGLDVFYDAPVNKEKGTALSFYAAYLYSDYGRNYIRNLGVMNAADGGKGYSGSSGAFNSGGGSAFSMNGTGSTLSAQLGYKMKDNLLGEHGTLMPYVMTQLSGFQYYDYKVMSVYNVGVNWLIKGHNSKFSLDYQNRPYFAQTGTATPKETVRRGMVVLQYQLSF
ncbi:MAG: hypothetical protein H7259_00190 [Cytophagales bacterium]|nr:hypothetical protein [Cytophaga sp.]